MRVVGALDVLGRDDLAVWVKHSVFSHTPVISRAGGFQSLNARDSVSAMWLRSFHRPCDSCTREMAQSLVWTISTSVLDRRETSEGTDPSSRPATLFSPTLPTTSRSASTSS